MWTPNERAQYVREFLASGETQVEFCARRHGAGGPSARTLRAWVAAHTKPSDVRAEVRDIIARAVRDIEAVLQVFDRQHGLDRHESACIQPHQMASAAVPGSMASDPEPKGSALEPRPVDASHVPGPTPSRRMLIDWSDFD
jgi:hypothetical protein